MPMRCLMFLCLTMNLLASPGLVPGHLIPKVLCRADPTLSYALYLPSRFHAEAPHPVLFGFSPSGEGEAPVRHFQMAAERFGWIVVGSNDSRNGPLRPALKAADAVWKDVNERFRVDPRRSYAVGFSGGARMALRLVQNHPRRFAGLISIGAFGTGEARFTGLSHLGFYLVCGNEDFNHGELLNGRSELRRREWTALADRFEGGHRWPPYEVCGHALAYLQLCAQRRGLAPVIDGLEAELSNVLADRAEAAAGKGDLLLALRRWEEVVSNFPESPAAKRGREQMEVLGRAPSTAVVLRLEAEHEERVRELVAARSSPHYGETLARLIEQAKQETKPEALMARRLLGAEALILSLSAQDAMARKEWPRSASLLRTLAAVEWGDPWPCIFAAGSLVQQGRKDEALAFLREAHVRGYQRPDRLRTLELLSALNGDPRYKALLKDMESKP